MFWKILPRSNGVEDSKNAVEYLTWFTSWILVHITIRKFGLDMYMPTDNDGAPHNSKPVEKYKNNHFKNRA